MSIIKTTKYMIHHLDPPMFLLEKICLTIVYILSRCSCRVLKDKILEEAFTGNKPQVAHVYDFDFPIYIHIPNEKMTKMKPSSLKGVLWVTLRL
jgi:hypothetical protein